METAIVGVQTEPERKLSVLDKIYSRLRRTTNNTSFIPHIDGLRFLAILLVVMEHVHGLIFNKSPIPFAGNPTISQWWFYVLFQNGRKGVLLFFVISGFILALPFAKYYWRNEQGPKGDSSQLQNNKQAKPVNLKAYFMRRLTRLEPPYIFNLIACTFLLIWFGHPDFAGRFAHLNFFGILPSLAESLVYLHNIISPNGMYVNTVTWSLEVEIQFYLLVPLLVQILKLKKLYRRTALVFLIGFFIFLQQVFPTNLLTLYSFIQYFLLGFLLVDLYLSGWQTSLNKWLSLLIGMLVLFNILYIDIYRTSWTEYLFVILVFGFYTLVFCSDVWKKIFSWRFFTTVGGMCYTIYLWHNPIASGLGNHTVLSAAD